MKKRDPMKHLNKISSGFLKRANDPEYQARKAIRDAENLYRFMNTTHAYQIGYLLGELIILEMPTLSTNYGGGRVVIKVNDEDTAEEERLIELHRKARDLGEKDKYGNEIKGTYDESYWNAYIAHRRSNDHKYLPNPWEYIIPGYFRIPWNLETKEGMRDSLWQSDVCTYSVETFEFMPEHDNNFRYDRIKFFLDEK
jgi:hypothetical protein